MVVRGHQSFQFLRQPDVTSVNSTGCPVKTLETLFCRIITADVHIYFIFLEEMVKQHSFHVHFKIHGHLWENNWMKTAIF